MQGEVEHREKPLPGARAVLHEGPWTYVPGHYGFALSRSPSNSRVDPFSSNLPPCPLTHGILFGARKWDLHT